MIAPMELPQISYRGMRDSADPSTADPRLATLLQNVYPQDSEQGAAIVGRPGYQQAGSQLGAGGRVQAIYQFTRLDGTEYTVGFGGGLMSTFNWMTRAWTKIALVGVALPTAGIVYCTTYNNQLVVNPNDGVNKPWMWDGTTFTSLTNAPLAYGQPTVYYAKLHVIRWLNRSTFDWSEENAANTGYTAGGFNNTWLIGQSDQNFLVAILGTDSAFYYWRGRSLGYVMGAVTTNYSSTGVRDGISTTVGTLSPNGIVRYENAVFFLSADGRPYRLDIGGGLTPLWSNLRETLWNIPRTYLSLGLGTGSQGIPGDPLTNLVFLGVADVGATEVTMLIAVDVRTNQIAGLWRGFTPTALAFVKDVNGQPVLMHGTASGYIYDHGTPSGSLWNDQANPADGGTVAIIHKVTGTPVAFDVREEKYFAQLDLSLRVVTTQTLGVDYLTPSGAGAAQTITGTGTTARWDGTWNGIWLGATVEQHLALGIDGWGRWLQPRITHATGTEQFGLVAIGILAYSVGADTRAA
jgi:hypothetical protein